MRLSPWQANPSSALSSKLCPSRLIQTINLCYKLARDPCEEMSKLPSRLLKKEHGDRCSLYVTPSSRITAICLIWPLL